MIIVENLHRKFREQKVLKGINLNIQTGELVALVGGSGTGKTVLLKTMAGLMCPDKGRVLLDGHDIHRATGRERDQILNTFGMVFQGGALFDSMSVFDNVAFPAREKTRMNESEIHARVNSLLDRVGLPDAGAKYPSQLSGGMKKRVALARALILDPSIIFFDEPTTGLDPAIANSILRLVYGIQAELNFTGVIVTHDLDRVFPVVNRVAMLYNGTIIEDTDPDSFRESCNPVVKRFVEESMKGPLEAIANV